MHKGYILSGMASTSKNAVGNQAETNYDKNKRKQQAQRSKDDCTNPENSCPLLYQSQQILSYQHCHKRIDGKQINAPLTLGDAVEDKDYQNDQPREQLYRRLVAESSPALLQPQQQGIPFRQAMHVFPLQAKQGNYQNQRPGNPSPNQSQEIIPYRIFVGLVGHFAHKPPGILLQNQIEERLSTLSVSYVYPS